MVAVTVLLASLAVLANAKPSPRSTLVVHEARSNVPSGFAHSGAPSPETPLQLRIAIAERDTEGLQNALMDVSTPGNAKYGQHLSKEEVEEFVRPTQDSVDAVNAFLASHGINATSVSPAGDWLGFTVPVNKANEMFDADFSVFTHLDTGKQAIRTMSYSIPQSLKGHLDLVHPTTTFPSGRNSLPVISSPVKTSGSSGVIQGTDIPSSCNGAITPQCLQALYGIPTKPATQSSNTLGVSGFTGQFAQQADLQSFLQQFRQDISPDTTFALQTLDGGSNPQDPNDAGIEANLDIQYTVGVATGVPVTFISVGDQSQDGDLGGFLDIVNFLLAESNPPHVLTTSYGENEGDISQQLAVKLCNAYAQLGARGTSVLFASGDGGVSGSQSGSCDSFVPTFPSGCPYLTSVGATTGVPETAVDFSSGGFSNYFPTPDYQRSAVSGYLSQLGSTNSGLFNSTGRAYPDVAAEGQDVQIVTGGQTQGVDGTSCSSPIFASVISLINDELIAAGRSPLGFLNPFLYAHPGALSDITSGSNPGCNTNGFPAVSGWDPVTGLGTPKYAALKAAAGL